MISPGVIEMKSNARSRYVYTSLGQEYDNDL
jgi:hypothetical protein